MTLDAVAARPTVGGPIRLAIVGGGPSCTYVLDRLAATAGAAPGPVPLEIHVFDRAGQFGAGQVHSPDQPVTSFLNRIVGQVAFAADESVAGAGPLLDPAQRPTLLEWCRERFEQTGDPAFDLRAEDWPKRYVHGLALTDQFERYVRLLREIPGTSVHLHQTEVVDLVEETEHGRLTILAPEGPALTADHVLMLTGHSSNDPLGYPLQAQWAKFADAHEARFVPSAYPLEESIDAGQALPGQSVGCLGMGLTAIDIILHLTEGRGGVYEPGDEGRLTYRPSGREPASIVVFSRAGLFTFARPFNAKEQDLERFEHRGRYLTEPAVDRLRASAGQPVRIGADTRRQLDFRTHLLPLVVLEMAQLYYTTLFGPGFAAALERRVRPEYEAFLADGGAGASGDGSTRRLLAPLEAAVDEACARIDTVLGFMPASPATRGTPEDWDLDEVVDRFLLVVHGPDGAAAVRAALSDLAGPARVLRTLASPWRHPSAASANRFSWERTLEPIPPGSYASGEEYRTALLDFFDVDHRWAAQDNLTNPAKAAADGVWRDLRDVLGHAVDFGGLTAASHRDFLDVYMRHHNRLCNGAALEVMEKIRAAVECGLVDVTVGPLARVECDEQTGLFRVDGPLTGVSAQLDLLVDSRVHTFDAARDVRALYPNLLRRGLVRKWSNPGAGQPDFEPGGLDLTEDFHPVRADGAADHRVTLLGPPSEGVMFFQLGALRPNQNHHVMQDILRWLRGFWPTVDQCAALTTSTRSMT